MNGAMHWAWAGILIAGILCGCSSAESRKASYVAHGKAYYAAGDYTKARLEFSNAAQIDPNDAEARLMLGQIAEKLGDVRAALGQYQAAITLDSHQATARAAMGRLYLYGGLAKKALELTEPGLASDPKNAQLLTVRGAAREQLGDGAGALADARMAQQLAPDNLYAIALLASIYKDRSQFDQAGAVIETALRRFPNNVDLHSMQAELDLANQQPAKAEAELQRIIELEPNVLTHRYRLASFYLQQKDTSGAEAALRAAVRVKPDSVDAKLAVVELLAAQRGIGPATAQVDQYLAGEPNNDGLKLTLGEFLVQNNHPEDAERAFRAVIAHAGIGADGLAARNRLASLLITRNDSAAASSLITQVLKENVRDNDALILRSSMSLGKGETQAAIADLRAVLRDQPNAVPIMCTLAQAYQHNDEPELAEQTLRAAIQVAPKDVHSRLLLAQVLTNANKLDEADSLLLQLTADEPGNVPVKESLFRLQVAQKDYPAALATTRRIQVLVPRQGLGYFLAGLTEELQQKPEQAQKDYEQALQLQPDSGEPLAALVRLDLGHRQGARAMTRIEAVLARSPGNVVARKLKGELLMTQGQPDAAIAAYEDALKVAPNWDLAYQGLALAQTTARRYDDAVGTLLAGIRQTQGSTLLIGDLGRLYERMGRSNDAIALYDGVLAKNPSASFAANNLAMLLVTYRQDAASIARAQDLAAQLASSADVAAIDTRGWVKFKSGDAHGAETLLRQAVDKQPADPELRYHLGMAQLHSGEHQPAQQNLETALSSSRPFVGRDEAKAALARLKSDAPVS
jgi:tetratricopeptide (TPR) repeat protein